MRRLLVLLFLSAFIAFPSRADELRDVNVKLYPLNLILKLLSIDVDIGIFRSVTLGPMLGGATYDDPKHPSLNLKFGQFGLRSNIYLSGNRFTDGFFVGPSLSGLTATLSETQTISGHTIELSGKATAGAFGVIVGYQWVWNNGFNLDVGAGGFAFSTNKNVVLSGSDPSIGTVSDTVEVPVIKGFLPWVELGMGWAF